MNEIIRQEAEDGKIYYIKNRRGDHQIDTYFESFYDLVSKEIGTLEDLLNIAKGGQYDRLIYIAETVIVNLRRLMDEADDFMLEEFGQVAIERAMWGQDIPGVKGGQMLGVVFKPAKKGELYV